MAVIPLQSLQGLWDSIDQGDMIRWFPPFELSMSTAWLSSTGVSDDWLDGFSLVAASVLATNESCSTGLGSDAQIFKINWY